MKLGRPARFALWSAAGLSAGLLALWWLANHRRGMAWAIAVVKERFPDVSQLPAESLAQWLRDPQRAAPLLLDTRSTEEFETSHLPGATRLDPGTSDAELSARIPKDRPVVLYCSAGYRASQMARRLHALGCANAVSLEGGIFQWANEGREMESRGALATAVHPVSRAFRRLLHPRARD